MKHLKIIAAFALIWTIWWIGKIAFGTFLVDPFMLFVCGTVSTYFIFRFGTEKSPEWLRKTYLLLFFLGGIFPLWIGGILPYYDLIDPKEVYFGLLPRALTLYGGNDFMWNGLGVSWLFGRVVPLELIPTYRYFWFNALAWFVWFGLFIPVLGAGVLVGRAMSFQRKFKLWKMGILLIAILLTGILLSFSVVALTSVVVNIYI